MNKSAPGVESKLFEREELFASVCFLLASTYWPTLLLIGFAIPILELTMGNFRRYLVKLVLIESIAIASFGTWSAVLSTNVSSTQVPGIDSTGQIHYLMTHFWLIPVIVVNSFRSNGIIWTKAGIGVLGWGTLYFPWAFYMVFIIVLGALQISVIRWRDLRSFGAIIGAVISILTFISFILLMYVVSTPVGALTVDQQYLQGRYFHPLMLIFAAMISTSELEGNLNKVRLKLSHIEHLLLVFFIIVTWMVLQTLQWRYWRR